MKKSQVILVCLLALISLLITCQAKTPITPTVTASPVISTTVLDTSVPAPITSPIQSTTSTPSNDNTKYGGVFRIIVSYGPRVLSGLEVGPNELIFLFPGMERLMDSAQIGAKGSDWDLCWLRAWTMI